MKIDDTSFDRLVDDELSEEERRELLSRLDEEPDGWRRCALAFLEAQCWKKSFASMVRTHDVQPTAKASPYKRQSDWLKRLNLVVAMAASFLLAFWAISVVERAWMTGVENVAGAPGNVATREKVLPKDLATVEQVQQPRRTVASTPWRVVKVSTPGSFPGETFDLPAVEQDAFDQQWLRNLPAAMPDEVVQAFNRTGHRVEQHRQLVPMPLQDGRQMIVPVDSVDVHYVGDKAY